MDARIRSVVLDATDIAGLAAFYQRLLGWAGKDTDDDWITLSTQDGWDVCFQAVEQHVRPRWPDPAYPQQLHIDVMVPDIDASADLAVDLGGTRLGGGETWHTVADPAGHPLDLCRNRDDDRTRVYAVTVDCPDPGELARFYAGLLGMQVRYEGEEGALIGADDQQGQLMFAQVSQYLAPRWPDPAYPQQLHLEFAVEDLDTGQDRVLELGGNVLPGGGKNFRVFADPAGHPFCLLAGA